MVIVGSLTYLASIYRRKLGTDSIRFTSVILAFVVPQFWLLFTGVNSDKTN